MRWLIFFLTVSLSLPATAATFRTGNEAGMHWLGVSGDVLEGDDKTFSDLAGDQPDLVIFLASPGGSVNSGLSIADIVYNRHYITVVPPDAVCASVCGAIWLGGQRRFIGDNSRVGFHAAFTESQGAIAISPYANAWLGAYFGRIGLSRDTIKYLVEADPSDMRWLTERDAIERGIYYSLVPRGGGSLVGQRFLGAAVPPAQREMVSQARTSDTTPNLTPTEAEGAARLGRRFNARFSLGGMDAVNESIDVCYNVVRENKKWDSGVYCAALDVLALMVGDKLADATQTPRNVRNSFARVAQRVDSVAAQLGFDGGMLRDRGSLVALVAANKIDTTQDPQALVQVGSNSDVVFERRSMVGSPRPRQSVLSTCSIIAGQFAQLSADFGNGFSHVFCNNDR